MHANYLELEEYEPPAWAKHLGLVPKQRYRLGMLPTPVHRWHLPGLPTDVEVWIKRDDVTGMQLSGNKVRKLEFLMAQAKQQGHDCVITIGGIQSNHCRATAVAARYLGLQCHLLLRVSRVEVDQDPGLVGNLLVDRLSGAVIHKVTKEEYVSRGSVALCLQLEAQLRAAGHHPYVIPVGGSSPLGTWGYLEAVEEVRQQQQGLRSRQQPGSTLAGSTAASDGDQGGFFTDIAMACGSGGTTTGLALGCHLSGLGARVHAYGVCDDPAYFYNVCDDIVKGLMADGALPSSRDLLRAVQAKGEGYAMSTREELQTMVEIAQSTGVILDPVYSGKAVHTMLAEMRQAPEEWAGRRVLFWHTGGLMGVYDKTDQLKQLLSEEQPGQVQRMAVK